MLSASSDATPKTWGIIAGILVAALALVGPSVILQPAVAAVAPLLPVSLNLKIAIVDTAIMVLAGGVVLAALAWYRQSPRGIGLKKPTPLIAAQAFLALVGYMVISVSVQFAARQWLPLNMDEPQELGYQTLSSIELAAAFTALVIITPFVEELIFRGFMFTGFRRRLPFWAAAIAVSALFGLVHAQWNVGLDVFILGLFACYLVEKTKNLWSAIFLHMFKNGIAFYLVYLYNGT